MRADHDPVPPEAVDAAWRVAVARGLNLSRADLTAITQAAAPAIAAGEREQIAGALAAQAGTRYGPERDHLERAVRFIRSETGR
jgi:hypothetical protein